MPPPEGTKFPFQEALRIKDLLTPLMWVDEWTEQPLEEGRFQDLAKLIYRALKLKISSWDALVRTLQPLYGDVYVEEKWKETVWRISAGLPWIKQGHVTKPAFVKHPEHWVSLLVEDVQYTTPSKKGAVRVKVWFRILGGTFSGLAFTQLWPHWYHTREVSKELGFPLWEAVHYKELVYARLGGLLNTENPNYPTLTEVYGASGAVTYNRKMRKERAKDCLRGYEWLCHECSIGLYGTKSGDGCIRATHPLTYVQRACERCSDDLPEAGCVGVGRHSFEEDLSRAIGQRTIRDIRVARDPPDIGGAPEDVAFLVVEDVLVRERGEDEITTRCMQDALRLSGRARRVEDFGVIVGAGNGMNHR